MTLFPPAWHAAQLPEKICSPAPMSAACAAGANAIEAPIATATAAALASSTSAILAVGARAMRADGANAVAPAARRRMRSWRNILDP